jgi:hypothetical protein
MRQVQPQARTTPRTSAGIKQASETLEGLAQRYNLGKATPRKWKNREDVQDRSHRPHKRHTGATHAPHTRHTSAAQAPHKRSTTLTPGQEAMGVERRRRLLLPLDDLLVVARAFIHAAVSRFGLDRCLRRHGVSPLRDLQVLPEGEVPRVKTFKDDEPGFIHVDIRYLPQIPGEGQRR